MSTAPPDPQFEALLDYLRRTRGFDFTGYKRSSLMRRVGKRMQMIGVVGYADYLDYLEVHLEEFGHLFDAILINVTAFFRDPAAWEALQAEIVPRLLAGKRAEDPIRVWSAGCASGEEAYSLAMILAEAIGLEEARERVKVYATDVDEAALARARQAVYEAKEIEGVPEGLREKYFEPVNGRYVFHKDLRRSVIFGRHDLIQDAPISRIDLLVCRNTLMYFNTETQSRILDRFHFALNDRGFLFLGKAETLLTYNNTFVPIDLKRRIFAKVPKGHLRERLFQSTRAGGNDDPPNHLVGHVRLREAAFDSGSVAQLVVDFSGLLALANDRARTLFGLAPADLGRPLQDLQVSYRPAGLRSCLDRAYTERRPVDLNEVEWPAPGGDPMYYDIHVAPLTDAAGSLLGAGISFLDVTANRRLKDDLQKTNRELETAYEELQSTNEELETTNEELQSTVEELETAYEELQSTNEELETMNEELQSTNEELETVNEELRQRSDELNQVNQFLESILGSLRGGVAVVDGDFLVRVWNRNAEDLWGLRPEEVRGKNLLNLDIGLPVHQLRPAIRACLAGETPYQQVLLDAINRRGKSIRCTVTCTPMMSGGDGVGGAILVMEDEDGSRPAGPLSEPGHDG
jgi:two-component system CheB/CheR fusion protein